MTAHTTTPGARVPGRLVSLLALVLLLEGLMYSVLTPLLPRLVDVYDLSKTAAGVLYSSYMIGSLTGALCGALVVRWAGVRRTTQVAFVMLGFAGIGFALSGSFAEAMVFRTATGLAGGISWVGAMSWLLTAESTERRGTAVGTAMGVAMFGTLLGPLLGNLALAIGDVPAFTTIAVLCGVAAPLFPKYTHGHQEDPHFGVGVRPAHRSMVALSASVWVLAVTAFSYGAVYVLLPLQLDDHGMSQLAIGWLFVGAAALSVVVIMVTGRMVDRHGAYRLQFVSMVGYAVALLYLATAGSMLVLAVTGVLASIGAIFAFGVTPVATAVSLDSDRAGLATATTSMLMLFVFAGSEGVGGIVVPAVAERTSNGTAFVALFLVAAASLLMAWLGHRARGSTPAPSAFGTSEVEGSAL